MNLQNEAKTIVFVREKMSSKFTPSTKFISTGFLFIKKVVLNILLRNLVLSSSLVLFPFQMHLGSPNILIIS